MTWGARGPWTLTGKDRPILTVVFAFQINITAHGGEEGDCTIRLEGGFELHRPQRNDSRARRLRSSPGRSWRPCSPAYGTTPLPR